MSKPKRGQQRSQYYTVAEAARVLGVHEDTIRRRGDAGRIPQELTAGHMAQRLYPKAAIDKLAEEKARYDRVWAEWEAEDAYSPDGTALSGAMKGGEGE